MAIILLGVSCTVMAITGGSDDYEPSAVHAESVCEDFVRDRLKAPSTAQFSDTTTNGAGFGEWTVTGSVDAENSFGAAVRSNYRCVVDPDTEGEWVLVSITGLN